MCVCVGVLVGHIVQGDSFVFLCFVLSLLVRRPRVVFRVKWTLECVICWWVIHWLNVLGKKYGP